MPGDLRVGRVIRSPWRLLQRDRHDEPTGLEEVSHRWQTMAEQDPLWAVLSFDGAEHGQWDRGEFFGIGVSDIDHLHAEASAMGVDPVRGSALDFGCGVGRLSLALAADYQAVVGVDVSDAMVSQARETADTAGVANARFVVNTKPSLPFDDASFDFEIAWIVLQHLPPALARTYIAELLRVLKPGGTLVFQLPGELLVSSHSRSGWKRRLMAMLPNEWVQQIHRFRAGTTETRELPMHGVRRHKIIDYVEAHGGLVAAVIEDNAAGSAWRSFHYFVQRRPQAPS